MKTVLKITVNGTKSSDISTIENLREGFELWLKNELRSEDLEDWGFEEVSVEKVEFET